MQINIHETTVNINDIKIFGVNDLKIGKDYLIIKKNDNNLIHLTDHSKEENPYFTVVRVRDRVRLAHNYKYSNFIPLDIIAGYNNKTL
jgi:hypothetical protein